jgi:hypothetical protein
MEQEKADARDLGSRDDENMDSRTSADDLESHSSLMAPPSRASTIQTRSQSLGLTRSHAADGFSCVSFDEQSKPEDLENRQISQSVFVLMVGQDLMSYTQTTTF